MIRKDNWQAETIDRLVAMLRPQEAVRALAVFGSAAQGEGDPWSDIDVLLVLRDGTLEYFFPSLDWLQPLGTIYAYSQSSEPLRSTTRVCFSDFRRIDFVFTTEAGLEQIRDWQMIPFWKGIRLLFSHSPVADRLLAQAFAAPELKLIDQAQFRQMVNDFRFKSMLAVYKVVRNDLLIALHLTLEMMQDYLVLGMILRDREYGTSHHREGGMGNHLVEHLDAQRTPYTQAGILDQVAQISIDFDGLAKEWSPDYHPQRESLLAWIQYAREHLGLK